MDNEDCNIIKEFNEKYQGEVGEQGHNIQKRLKKAKEKNDIKLIQEYETDLRIAGNLNEISDQCPTQNTLTTDQCKKLSEGIDSWNKELEYWTSRWYIKPFVGKKSLDEQRTYVQKLLRFHEKSCKKRD